MEEAIIKKIKGGIFGIKQGTKQPKDVAMWLNKLKPINPMMYEECLQQFKAATYQAYKVRGHIFKHIRKCKNI